MASRIPSDSPHPSPRARDPIDYLDYFTSGRLCSLMVVCVGGVWIVWVDGVWMVYGCCGWCVDGVWMVCGWCLGGVTGTTYSWKVYGIF